MAGEYITVNAADGGSFQAYVAKPPQGSGPGVVLLQEIFGINWVMRHFADRLAEEGYVAIVPDMFWRIEPGTDLDYTEDERAKAFAMMGKFDNDKSIGDIDDTIGALKALPEHAGKVGAIGFCLGGKLAYMAAARLNIDCAISYYGVGIENYLDELGDVTCPVVMHFAELDGHVPPEAVAKITEACAGRDDIKIFNYAGADHGFARPRTRPLEEKPAALMAYSRTLDLLRSTMGPHFNLDALWDKHCEYEFATRDVKATMGTMVSEPYVNHIPTMTGGVGQDQLARFYKHHFVDANPADTKLIPISRTIGTDRLVDEMLFCFTHDMEIDWMLPGVAPTGKYVEIPLVAIVNFRGDKLYHEHIYWDQASVLVQIGRLDPAGLPVAGAETARKLVDESNPSNTLMAKWASSEGKPI